MGGLEVASSGAFGSGGPGDDPNKNLPGIPEDTSSRNESFLEWLNRVLNQNRMAVVHVVGDNGGLVIFGVGGMTFLVVTGVAICTGSFFPLNSVYQGQFNRSLFDFVSETAGYIRQVSESAARAAANSDTVAANSGVVAEAIQSGSSTLQSSGSALTGFVSTLNDLLAQLTNGSSQNGFILGVAVGGAMVVFVFRSAHVLRQMR